MSVTRWSDRSVQFLATGDRQGVGVNIMVCPCKERLVLLCMKQPSTDAYIPSALTIEEAKELQHMLLSAINEMGAGGES